MEAASIPEQQPRAGGALAARSPATFIWDNILLVLLGVALLYFLVHDFDRTVRRPQDRPLQRHDLGADRARLHARLRHHRADQLRPRRGVHDRLVRERVALADARPDATRPRRRPGSSASSRCSRSRCSPCGSLNVMIERVAYRPLRNAPKLAPLITAIGMCFILQNVGLLWRPTPDASPDLIRSQSRLLHDLRHRHRALRRLRGRRDHAAADRRCCGSSGARSTARRCARPRRTPTPRG